MAAPKYRQGDLVQLKDPAVLPDGTAKHHPFLIISHATPNSVENTYLAIMMTGSANTDRFSFPCTNEMFESPLSKDGCNFRLYIVFMIREVEIQKFMNRMLSIYVKMVIKHINERVLTVD